MNARPNRPRATASAEVMEPLLDAPAGAAPLPGDAAGVVAALRQQIRDGQWASGQRLAEIPVAAALGVSRTPVRFALRALAQEGLLQAAGKRGYAVRAFTEDDVLAAVEVRGVLEGLAARRLAERGMNESVRHTLADCLQRSTALLAAAAGQGAGTAQGTGVDIAGWTELNQLFHDTILGASGTAVIADAVARNNHIPFAGALAFAFAEAAPANALERLRVAHLQHTLVFEALQLREGARADMLMREHAYIGLRYGRLLGVHGH